MAAGALLCDLVRALEHVHRTGDPCEGDVGITSGKYGRIGMDLTMVENG